MSNLKNLYLSTRFSDVAILANDGQKLPAHRCILSQNEYFDRLFSSNMKDSMEDTIVVDLSAEHARMMLALIYHCDIPGIHDQEELDIELDVTEAKYILDFMCNTRKYMMQKYFFDPNDDGYCVLLGLITWKCEKAFIDHLTIGELESIFELWAESMSIHGIKGCTIHNALYIYRYIDLATQPETIDTITAHMVAMVLSISPIETRRCCITRLAVLWTRHNLDPIGTKKVMDALMEIEMMYSVKFTTKERDCENCKRSKDSLAARNSGAKMDALSTSLLENDEVELLNERGNDLGGDE
jgi:hypothetical protein